MSKKLENLVTRYRKTAHSILARSKLVDILSKYGQVRFTGGYGADLLIGPDIDIYVMRNTKFKKKEVLGVLNDIVEHTNVFYAHYFGDWNHTPHQDFPKAYYTGFKAWVKGEKWKIDVWFLTPAQVKKVSFHNLNEQKLSRQERELILKLKYWKNQNGVKVSGTYVYDAVLNKNVRTIAGFRKYLKESNK